MENAFDIITGADGFIGRELSEELSKSKLILLSRSKKNYKNKSLKSTGIHNFLLNPVN